MPRPPCCVARCCWPPNARGRGNATPPSLRAVLAREIATAPLARVDYAEVVDAEDLQPVRFIDKKTLLAVAVFFGRTRLIDNLVVPPVRPA